MNNTSHSRSTPGQLLAAACGIACSCLSAHAQVSQTYSPSNWVNAVSTPNLNHTLTDANTTHLACQKTGPAQI